MPTEMWKVQGLDAVNATLSEHLDLLREVPSEAKIIGESMSELTRVERQYRKGLIAVRTEWRNQHAAWIETMRAARRVQSVFRDFRGLFQTYTLSMIRIEQAQRDVVDAQKDAAYYQDLYNQYLRDFGEASPLTEDAFNKMQDAMKQAKDEQDALNKAQNDMLAFWLDAGVEMPISVAFAVTGIASNLNTLKEVIAGAGGINAALASLKVSVLGATAALAPLAATLGMAFFVWAAFAGLIKPTEEELAKFNEELDSMAEGTWTIKPWRDEFKELEEQIHRTADELENLSDKAYRKSFFPEFIDWSRRAANEMSEFGRQSEEALRSMDFQIPEVQPRQREAEMSRIPTPETRPRPTVRNVTISNRFGDVHTEADMNSAMMRSYRKLMRMLETHG